MNNTPEVPSVRLISTEEFAQRYFVKPTSIRSHLCRAGSYFGIRPVKLPNGRLGWPNPMEECQPK